MQQPSDSNTDAEACSSCDALPDAERRGGALGISGSLHEKGWDFGDTEAQKRRFHRELDGMSDGTGHPETFDSWYQAHYNDGPIPVHTRYLDLHNYKGFRRKSKRPKGVDPAAGFMK